MARRNNPDTRATPQSVGQQSPGQMMNESDKKIEPTCQEQYTEVEERISEPLRTPTQGMQERMEAL